MARRPEVRQQLEDLPEHVSEVVPNLPERIDILRAQVNDLQQFVKCLLPSPLAPVDAVSPNDHAGDAADASVASSGVSGEQRGDLLRLRGGS